MKNYTISLTKDELNILKCILSVAKGFGAGNALISF